MEHIILSLLTNNGYLHVDRELLNLQLLSHPEYPSLKSITDTLDYFEIENLAATVPKEALDQMPASFLALAKGENGDEVVLVEKKRNGIHVTNPEEKKEKLTEAAFSERWTGTIVAVEEQEKASGIQSIQQALPYFVVAAVASANVILNFSISYLLYTSLTLVGLYISILIIREDLGIKSKAVAKVCGAISKTSTCGEVINTEGNKIFGIISLSDASFVFFAGLFLILSSIGFHQATLLGLSLAGIPVVIYALYRQGVVLKKWCALCLLIAGILILQTALLLATFNFYWYFFTPYIVKLVSIFALLYIGWMYCKSYWESHEKLATTETDFLKFKRNPQLFKTLLEEQSVTNANVIDPQFRVVFGNPEGVIKLQGVTNPLCGFCTAAFEAYDKLMTTYGNDIQLEFIFNVPPNAENKSTQIASQLIDLYTKDPLKSYAAFKDWFANRDVDSWQKKFGISENSMVLEVLEAHRKWCNTNDVNYTPASILNNQFFPKSYEIKDLPLFIQDMILELRGSEENA
ncbi:vitamin K epoxide reductase family protein [Kordia sp. SMS9]|uniref:vitamin K epoxide reductase family protein n=1 Tax=Kordia sp. SMS9 TaxID=2282170 RepID=UPI000E0CFA35|nr:vitamin K epoxide reductase family protein [Kordia sp. SMS9]AXG68272.1 vitamin K epoxide reductase family protein [Kordia sp. SMS9]